MIHIFHREHGLPLAKALDEEGRLRVVDADMEPHQVGRIMLNSVLGRSLTLSDGPE